VLDPGSTRSLLQRVASMAPRAPNDALVALGRLTAREREVLRWVARGLSNAEIGARMFVAPSSVKTHVSHLLSKLGTSDRVELVIFAYESGLVCPGVPDSSAASPPAS
jgi:DNA-binding NarL/FixJ family response regulator